MQRFVDKGGHRDRGRSGIGDAISQRFSDEGAAVVLAGDTLAELQRVAAGLPPERTLVKRTDMSKYPQVEALGDAAPDRGRRLHRQHSFGIGPGR